MMTETKDKQEGWVEEEFEFELELNRRKAGAALLRSHENWNGNDEVLLILILVLLLALLILRCIDCCSTISILSRANKTDLGQNTGINISGPTTPFPNVANSVAKYISDIAKLGDILGSISNMKENRTSPTVDYKLQTPTPEVVSYTQLATSQNVCRNCDVTLQMSLSPGFPEEEKCNQNITRL